MSKNSIESEIVINAPIEVVWDVITKPEHISKWFAPTTLDLRVGGKGIVTAHGESPLEIVKIEKPHIFSYQWTPPDSDGNISLVEFTLSEHHAETRLRVTESVDRSMDEKTRDPFISMHNTGWTKFFGNLPAYVARVMSEHHE